MAMMRLKDVKIKKVNDEPRIIFSCYEQDPKSLKPAPRLFNDGFANFYFLFEYILEHPDPTAVMTPRIFTSEKIEFDIKLAVAYLKSFINQPLGLALNGNGVFVRDAIGDVQLIFYAPTMYSRTKTILA